MGGSWLGKYFQIRFLQDGPVVVLNAVISHSHKNRRNIKRQPWFITPAVYEWPKKNHWVISHLNIYNPI